MSTSVADVAVVGLGAVGSAACHHLAKLGARVVGIDRHHPPHDHGSSHGLTRITRLAVGEGDAFVPLVARSHVLWRELEKATGRTLYRRTGGLILVDDGADVHAYHGHAGFFARTVAIAEQHGIAHDLLDADAIRTRFPMFAVAPATRGYWERDAGVLYPEEIVAAHLDESRRCGAVLRLGERVRRVEPDGDAVRVVTDRGSIAAQHAVVAAGPWLAQLVGEPAIGRRLRVCRQVLHWFRPTDPGLFAPERCPVWIWMHGPGAAGTAYGFPTVDDVRGVKVATEQDSVEIDPERVERTVSAAEHAAMFADHLDGRVRGLSDEVVRSATCLYTLTSDAAFVVRPHPESAAITVVSACSGHGFKHSAAVGEALARRVTGAGDDAALRAFGAHAG